MSTDASNPNGTGEVFNAQNAFASLLAVEDGEQKQGEAQPEEADAEYADAESDQEVEAEVDEMEADAESEESEVSDEAEEQPTTFLVKVDGTEIEVTLDELQKGYSRTQDYTRKTQALAEQRKAAEAELEAVRQERAQLAQVLELVQGQLSLNEPEPNWDELYRTDPIEWVRQRELHREKQEKLGKISAEQQRLMAVQQQEQAKFIQQRLAEEAQKLLDAIPEWKDAKAAKADREKLVEYGKTHGFTEEELRSVADHRAVVLLKKAAAYDELMAKKTTLKPKPTQGVRPARPGSASAQPTKATEAKRAQERLAKTGNLKDAVAAFDQFI